MAERMSKRERVMATVRGEPVDRPAYGFWRHYFEAEYSVARHVAATLWWQDQVQNDFLKVQPRASFFVEDWGAVFRYPTSGVTVGGGHSAPREEGVVSFSPASSPPARPVREDYPVKSLEDWKKLRVLAPDEGALGERLLALRMIRDGLRDDVPFMETIFSPLSIAARLVDSDDEMERYLREQPQVVHEALETITRTYSAFVGACLQAGASGIFFATTQWATTERLSESEYREFGRQYDLRVLEAAREASFNMLHVCHTHNMLFALSDYPVQALNWASSSAGNPSVQEAAPKITNRALVAGVTQPALAEPSPDTALAQVRQAWDATGGRRWMAGPDCSVPVDAPVENCRAVGRLLRGEGKAAAR